nr:pyranose dehydrogenase 1 [Quercus suber]
MVSILFFGILTGACALPLNSPLLESYDYIIVGGGPGGLTVANRLSEDPSVNVILLEAGPADHGEPAIAVPGFIGQAIGGQYDWNLTTEPQAFLDGKARELPQGRALGGGSLINGMLWNRGGQLDYQDWVTLGNAGWSWSDMLPYFKKSETYTPVPSAELADQYSIQEETGVHGFAGPVNISFPRYFWNSSALLFSALNELGVPTAYDPNDGLIAGASFLPLSMNPSDESRCTARRAYFDSAANRLNLWISTGQHVTQVLFESSALNANATATTPNDSSVGQGSSSGKADDLYGWTSFFNATLNGIFGVEDALDWLENLRNRLKRTPRVMQRKGKRVRIPRGQLVALGVQYAADAQSARRNITATREIIISAGALHSPQLLMLSGIGPASTLQDLSIPVNLDLAGVGSNLHDHGQSWCWFQYTNASFTNPMTENITAATEQYWANRTGLLTANVIDGVAFPPLTLIVNGSTSIMDEASLQSAEQYLSTSTDSTVMAGYAAQQPLLVAALRDATRASYEILNANDGVLTVANMRPLSRGTVTINSSNAFDIPVIDPRYGSNPVDLQVLLAAMRFNERLIRTNSMALLEPIQVSPAAGLSDEAIIAYLRRNLGTEYHVGGTCAMMPQALGGVVDSNLLVYGTNNLRIVDASIMPMLPAGHLQAVVYGIAEKVRESRGCSMNFPSG